MFPASYFAKSYFPGSYFPPAVTETEPENPSIPTVPPVGGGGGGYTRPLSFYVRRDLGDVMARIEQDDRDVFDIISIVLSTGVLEE